MAKSFVVGQVAVLSAALVVLTGLVTVSGQSSFGGTSMTRRFRAVYRRLLDPTASATRSNISAGLRRAMAADIKAMDLNSRQAPRVTARFNRSSNKERDHQLDIVAYNTREHPFVAMLQIKVFVDGKEIFQSLGGGDLGAPGTGLFFCPIPRTSQPRVHIIRVVDTASGATTTLREKF